jgi:hypothetical protein
MEKRGDTLLTGRSLLKRRYPSSASLALRSSPVRELRSQHISKRVVPTRRQEASTEEFGEAALETKFHHQFLLVTISPWPRMSLE